MPTPITKIVCAYENDPVEVLTYSVTSGVIRVGGSIEPTFYEEPYTHTEYPLSQVSIHYASKEAAEAALALVDFPCYPTMQVQLDTLAEGGYVLRLTSMLHPGLPEGDNAHVQHALGKGTSKDEMRGAFRAHLTSALTALVDSGKVDMLQLINHNLGEYVEWANGKRTLEALVNRAGELFSR